MINAAAIKKNQDTEGMLRRALERLIGLYKDKAHFIFELLQNAEDAKAKSIKFVLYDDRLEVFHDGKPFTSSNVNSLFNIGLSDKVNDLNQIGEFGVGFKSVFSICETVKFYSCPENFRDADIGDAEPFGFEIVNFYRPVDIPLETIPAPYTTKFLFPFAVNKPFLGFDAFDKLRNKLVERLTNLSETTLLFMRNLEVIEYDICLSYFKEKGEYMLDKHQESGWLRVQSLSDNSGKKAENQDKEYSYLVFSKKLELNGAERSVDIAFAYIEDENGNYRFVKSPEKNAFVYFPTGTESKLDFIVQGPYRTTPSRSEIPMGEDENKSLADMTAELVFDSVLKLRDAGKLNISLLKILPLNPENFYQGYSWNKERILDNLFTPIKPNNLFSPIYDKIKELFKNEDIIPTKNGGFVNAEHAILVRSAGLAEVFDDDDITELLKSDNRMHWVTEEITGTRADVFPLYNYLTDRMGIPVVTPDYLARSLGKNISFLKSKAGNIEWLIKFYNYLETVPAQFAKNGKNALLLPLRFVYTEKGEFVAPFRKTDDGKYIPNVFLPAETEDSCLVEDIDFVNSEVYRSTKNFFDNILCVEKPNEYDIWFKAVTKRFTAPYSVTDVQHLKDITNILKYFDNPRYTNDLQEMLRGKLLLKCSDSVEKQWHNPYVCKIYFEKSTDGINIKEYFKNIESVFFVDFDFYIGAGITYEQLKKLNVCDNLITDYDITSGTYDTGKPGTKPTWYSESDFRWLLSIKNLPDALYYIENNSDKPDAHIKSAVIFKLLLKYERNLVGNASVSGNNKALLNESCNAINIILKKYWRKKDGGLYTNDNLKKWQKKWLYTDSNELVSSTSISKYDLNKDLYGKVIPGTKLYDILSFLKDQRDREEAINSEFSAMDAGKQDAFVELWLSKHFNINISQLRDRLQATDNEIMGQSDSSPDTSESGNGDFEFEFPSEPVRNWELMQHHALQKFAFANPVAYQKKLISVKVSGIDRAVKTYLQHSYRELYGSRYACQLCHKPFVHIESCQIDENGKSVRELEPMHLCMCANCANEFRRFRNSSSYQDFLQTLKSISKDDIEESSPVIIDTDIGAIWFTQAHIAEISELMKLQEESCAKSDADKYEKKPDAVPSHQLEQNSITKVTNGQNNNSKEGEGTFHELGKKVNGACEFKMQHDKTLDYYGIKTNIHHEVFYLDRKYSYQNVPKVKVRIENVSGGYVEFTYCGGFKNGERAKISMQVAIANKCFITI